MKPSIKNFPLIHLHAVKIPDLQSPNHINTDRVKCINVPLRQILDYKVRNIHGVKTVSSTNQNDLLITHDSHKCN
jgi:hypothetical protein